MSRFLDVFSRCGHPKDEYNVYRNIDKRTGKVGQRCRICARASASRYAKSGKGLERSRHQRSRPEYREWKVNWRKADGLRGRERSWKQRGIAMDLASYFMWLEAQDGKCLLCEITPDKPLNVDHDHKTMRIRGLLCHPCNMAVGMLETRGLKPHDWCDRIVLRLMNPDYVQVPRRV